MSITTSAEGEGRRPRLRYAHEAMTTVFEIITVHDRPAYARQAAQEAFQEINRVEQDLSRFIAYSDVARINAAPVGEPVSVGPRTLACLAIARQAWEWSGGVFDVTLGALIALWKDSRRQGRAPTDEQIAEARAQTGMDGLEIDADARTVRRTRPGVCLDLGGVGKGFALDKAAEALQVWNILQVVVQGGGSTVLAFGRPPDEAGWAMGVGADEDEADPPLRILVEDSAVSASGTFVQGGHIIDPRTARPAECQVIRAWALAPNAALADALSTAFLVLGVDEVGKLCRRHQGVGALFLLRKGDDERELRRIGPWRVSVE